MSCSLVAGGGMGRWLIAYFNAVVVHEDFGRVFIHW
jgi:hypothetical protein